MIDRQKIKCDIIKALDILQYNDYTCGKVEVDFDFASKQFNVKIHTFAKQQKRQLRITEIIE
jgi:hypothetical protein